MFSFVFFLWRASGLRRLPVFVLLLVSLANCLVRPTVGRIPEDGQNGVLLVTEAKGGNGYRILDETERMYAELFKT
jgi:hypothetical protein